jgi:hypothetical protein
VDRGRGRTVHHGPAMARTRAHAVVWWPGDDEEAAVEEKFSSSNAQASGEGEKRGVGAVRTGGGVSLL